MKKQKGITLIALVITIVVLLILAGITITGIFSENGLIAKVQEAVFKTYIKSYQEMSDIYVVSQNQSSSNPNGVEINTRQKEENPNESFENEFTQDQINREFDEVFKKANEDFKNKICTYHNDFYYIPINETKEIQNEVKWCFDVNVKVWGYDNYDDYINDINTPKGEYVEKNGVYVCEPDLSSFNKETTYYVTYDEEGNETISPNIKNTTPPEDWYDYANNKWANIVTISDDMKAYWVWIPRYVYNIDEQANEKGLVNIKFVDTKNNYIDYKTKQKTNYPDIAPTYDENGYQTNYSLPEAFTWDRGGEKQKELPGYWVSKYEISTTKIDAEFLFSMDINSITIQKADTSKVYTSVSSYDIYLNGEFLDNTKTLPYTIPNLEPNTEYQISAVAKTSAGAVIGTIGAETVKTLEKNINELTAPDLTGFSKENTFYVQYNGDTISSESIPISQQQPSNWYDYANSMWANIVTVSQNKTDNPIHDNLRSYFVWIPRYEYKVKDRFSNIQIRFITKEQTTPTKGYQIPDAFTWQGQALSGYWVSKYEISEVEKNVGQFFFTPKENSIIIEEVNIYDGTASSTSKYDIYVDDILNATNVSIPYTISGLNANTQYQIRAVAKSSTGTPLGKIEEEAVKTLETNIKTLTKPDLTGFNPNNTYYVTYDEEGNETRTPITSSMPSNWYDYENSKWANIVTTNNGKEAYFVWIPRYEYKVKDRFSNIQIRFITKEQTTPSQGYQIPAAFTWDNYNNLQGYWVSKYEVSE